MKQQKILMRFSGKKWMTAKYIIGTAKEEA